MASICNSKASFIQICTSKTKGTIGVFYDFRYVYRKMALGLVGAENGLHGSDDFRVA